METSGVNSINRGGDLGKSGPGPRAKVDAQKKAYRWRICKIFGLYVYNWRKFFRIRKIFSYDDFSLTLRESRALFWIDREIIKWSDAFFRITKKVSSY